jgi:hypothetical protein
MSHPSPNRPVAMSALRRMRLRAAALIPLLALSVALTSPGAQAAPKTSSINLVPTLTSISIQGGQLVAAGFVTATVKGTTTTVPFTGVPVTISLAGGQAGACPILDLSLGPINVNLLGLVVQTSPICLKITAFAGGGLLGDLLCQVGQLLNGGLPLSQILAGQGLVVGGVVVVPGLTPAQISQLTSGLTNLFNGALGQLVNAILTLITQGTGHTCAILHLELGPIDLTLLGLNVHLDNCHNGPVTVDITGQTGQGNLLGNLLCELLGDGQLHTGLTLQQIINLILGLLN